MQHGRKAPSILVSDANLLAHENADGEPTAIVRQAAAVDLPSKAGVCVLPAGVWSAQATRFRSGPRGVPQVRCCLHYGTRRSCRSWR